MTINAVNKTQMQKHINKLGVRLLTALAFFIALSQSVLAQAATEGDIITAATAGLGDIKGYVIGFGVLAMGIAIAYAVWKHGRRGISKV